MSGSAEGTAGVPAIRRLPDTGEAPATGKAPALAEPAARPPAPRGWHLALAAGVYPPLLLGFLASALANRLAFVGWGAVAAMGHAALLRAAWGRGWSAAARAALTLAWAALAALALAGLVERHHEILDLGYRAVLWAVYAPALTRAATWQLAAGALAAAALAAAGLAAALVTRRRRPQ